MKSVKIIKTVQKFPGGMMVIPLFLGCVVNTLFPGFLRIGGFTSALLSNSAASTFVALFIFCCGASINVRQIGKPFYKGGVLIVTKVGAGILIGTLVGKIFGPAGFLTITPLACIAALTNSNSVMYSILAQQYGEPTDVGAVSVLALKDGPFFTMIALGLTGMANIPFMSVVAVLIPLGLGMLLGNLDEDVRSMCEKGQPIIVPFNGFCLGAGMDLMDVVKAGIPGIILGLISLIVTGFICYWVYNLFFGRKKKTAVGFGCGNTAGNAVATPAAVAEADPTMAAIAPVATAQVAAACVITALLCPLVTAWLAKRLEAKEAAKNGGGKAPASA